MLKKFTEIEVVDIDNGFYNTRYTDFDSVGNDMPKDIAINTNYISTAKEIYGFSENDRWAIEKLDTEEALERYYNHLFTEITMNNGNVINIYESLGELLFD